MDDLSPKAGESTPQSADFIDDTLIEDSPVKFPRSAQLGATQDFNFPRSNSEARPGTADFEASGPNILNNVRGDINKVAPEPVPEPPIELNPGNCEESFQVVAARRPFLGWGSRNFSLFQNGRRILAAKQQGLLNTRVVFANSLDDLDQEKYSAELVPFRRGFVLQTYQRSESAWAAFKVAPHSKIPVETLTVALNNDENNVQRTSTMLQEAVNKHYCGDPNVLVLDSESPEYIKGGKLRLGFKNKSALPSSNNLVFKQTVEEAKGQEVVPAGQSLVSKQLEPSPEQVAQGAEAREQTREYVLELGLQEGGTYFLDFKPPFKSLQAFALAIVRLL